MGFSNVRRSQDRASKRAARNELAAASVESSYAVPPPEECEPDELVTIQLSDTLRLVQRLTNANGRLVDFALMLQARNRKAEWVEIDRVDCRHGSLHRHVLGAQPSDSSEVQPIQVLHTRDDIDSAWDIAYDTVTARAGETERRWRDAGADVRHTTK